MKTTEALSPVQLWIRALETPEYWQTRGRLRGHVDDPQIAGHGFCPLGVLCDLFLRHAPEAARIGARWDGGAFCWNADGKALSEDKFLPAPVAAWWKRHHPMSEGSLMEIVEFSDRRRGSFAELALYLRGACAMPLAGRA